MAKKSTSTGTLKAARKAEAQGGETKVGKGEVFVGSQGKSDSDKRPMVVATVDRGQGTQQKNIPVKGKLSKFKQNVSKAESRAQSFIDGTK
jgi:hypothetical protein